jgi:zinc transporter ZupT
MEFDMAASGHVGLALMLTVLAGLSTGIGSAIAYFIRRPKIVYLAFSLGLSAGVMIYVSFTELRHAHDGRQSHDALNLRFTIDDLPFLS